MKWKNSLSQKEREIAIFFPFQGRGITILLPLQAVRQAHGPERSRGGGRLGGGWNLQKHRRGCGGGLWNIGSQKMLDKAKKRVIIFASLFY
jgi:hypothetical protein